MANMTIQEVIALYLTDQGSALSQIKAMLDDAELADADKSQLVAFCEEHNIELEAVDTTELEAVDTPLEMFAPTEVDTTDA
jgi:hypothetical protein